MYRQIFAILTFVFLSAQVHASATKELIKSALPEIKQLFAQASSQKLQDEAIKKYINDNLEASSPQYQQLIIDELKKVSPAKRPEKLADLMYNEKKFLKAGMPCYSVTNQCKGKLICGLPLVAKDQKYYEKCLIPKDEGQSCSQADDYCMAGTCKNMLRITNVNTCTTYKESCKRDSECCSNSCNQETKKCNANYKCSSCASGGQVPQEGQECCEALFKNTNGVCSPIIPVFTFFNWLMPSVQAATTDNSVDAVNELNSMMATLGQLFDNNQVTQSLADSYKGQIKSGADVCASKPISNMSFGSEGTTTYPRKECYEALIEKVSPELNYQQVASAKLAQADKIVSSFKKTTSANANHPLYTEQAFSQFEAGVDKDLAQCVNNLGAPGTNFSKRNDSIDRCVEGVKIKINDRIVQSDYEAAMKGEASTNPNYALFSGATESIPLFQDIHISDMKSCRVNLFGDFIAAQSNDYFEVMMMMFAMDYTTGGKDEGDFYHIKSQYNTRIAASGSKRGVDNQIFNWNVQTNEIRGKNIKKFDPAMVRRGALWDEFDETVGKSALNEINKYLTTLEEADRKVFLKMYYNGKLSGNDRDLIINYYMKKDPKYLDTFTLDNPKAGAGRYNIRDVVRFEAIKYKLHLFKLYGILQKRSLEMMCRCVDTVGPMSADDWLQPDVEENYLKNCNGLGKYDSYVINSEKEICTGEGEDRECTSAGAKDFSDIVTEKEKEEINKLGGNEQALTKNSVGKTVVQNGSYSIKDRNEDYFVQTLDQITACIGTDACEKTSRYDDFVKNGKLDFKKEREETAKGHGEDFSLFLRDMALMKIKAIEEASLQNINHGTALFEYTVQWLKDYNWNYVKYNGEAYTKSKKCYYPVCFILQNLQFLGSFLNKMLAVVTNFSSLGIILGGDMSLDLNPDRGPENICGPRTKSTWKKSKIPVGKKYKIKCMRFHAVNNDVCNTNIAVASCTRNTYVKKEGSDVIRLLDPFLPDMTELYGTTYRTKAKIPFKGDKHSIHNYYVFDDNLTNFYMDHAKGYFLSTLISADNGSDDENNDRKRMSDEFAQYAYRYHFFAPKVSKLDYYISPGLIPYFEMLISKLNNYMGQSLANLARTAAYALKMHNYNYIVNTGLTNATKIDRKSPDGGIPNVQLTSDFGQFTNWLSGFSTAANQFDEALAGDKTIGRTVRGEVEKGRSSANEAISQVSNGVRKQLDRNANRRANQALMRQALIKRGKSGDMAKLQAIADKRSSEHSSALSSLTEQFLKNALGEAAAKRAHAQAIRNATAKDKAKSAQEGYSQEAINVDQNSASARSRSASGSSDSGVAAAKASDSMDIISFDNLDNEEGLFNMDDDALVMLGDKKMTAGQLKSFINSQRESGTKRDQIMKSDNDWERENVSLFTIISERYQISAFPKMLK